MSGGTVGVVMVSYRTGPVLFAALRSALAEPDVAELVLVDNGNDAATRRFLAEMQRDEPRLKVVAGQGNVGFARGCNLGVRQTGSEFLVLMNPDCVVLDHVVKQLRDYLVADPDAWVVAPALVDPDGTRQRGTPRNILTPWIAMVEALRLDRLAPNHPYFRRLNLHEAADYSQPTVVPAASGAFLMMRRATYDDLGGFDEDYFLHVEDLDFCVRLSRAGGRLVFLPGLKVKHEDGSSGALPPFIEWHKARGFHRYFYRHFAVQYPRPFLRFTLALVYMQFAGRTLRWLAMPWAWRR